MKLFQFRASPFNEKVCWALDFKRVPHERVSLLPGPHMMTVRKLTGRTQTPVLLTPEGAIDGSAGIIDWLDRAFPEPRLGYDEPSATESAKIEAWFDDDLGPRIHRAILGCALASPKFFSALFGEGRTPLQKSLYALTIPLAAPLVRKGNGITGSASIDDGRAAAREGLDFVAGRAARSGYLLDDRFGRADLTAAAMLAMVIDVADSPMRKPQPRPSAVTGLLAEFADHPGTAWVNEIYRRHRGASASFDGPSAYGDQGLQQGRAGVPPGGWGARFLYRECIRPQRRFLEMERTWQPSGAPA